MQAHLSRLLFSQSMRPILTYLIRDWLLMKLGTNGSLLISERDKLWSHWRLLNRKVACCCAVMCMCKRELSVTYNDRVLGTIRQSWHPFLSIFYVRDATEKPLYRLRGPLCNSTCHKLVLNLNLRVQIYSFQSIKLSDSFIGQSWHRYSFKDWFF